jgi:subtilisin family serine protease
MNCRIKTALFFVLAVGLVSASFSIVYSFPSNLVFGSEHHSQVKRLNIDNTLSRSAYLSSSGYPDAAGFSTTSVAQNVGNIMPNSIPNLDEKTSSDSQQGSSLQTTNALQDALSSRLALQRDEARQAIGGQYIVVLKQTANSLSTSEDRDLLATKEMNAMASEMESQGAEILNTYQHALNGYTIKVGDDPDLLNNLRGDPRVALVEQDQRVQMFSQAIPTGIERIGASPSTATAGLRSQAQGTGSGNVNADIAILDTGIDLNHPDLNVYAQKTFVAGTSTASDDNGHGTHVAGIAAAMDNSIGVVGVAPGARLWAVKVLDKSGAGALSDVIAGIDYITAHANEIDVVNMSFGCQCESTALNSAVNNAVSAGITFVAAAGNSGTDASTFYPASNPNVIAVGAIADSDGKCGGLGPSTQYGNDDTFATFSNYGPKVSIAAPGVNILSTYYGGTYTTLSGTSMAAPHVAGAAALYKASHPNASPAEVKNALTNSATNASITCDGDGHGYYTGSANTANEPLLYVRNMK